MTSKLQLQSAGGELTEQEPLALGALELGAGSAGLTTLPAPRPSEGMPVDPVAILLAPPVEPLPAGREISVVLWGQAPGSDESLELQLGQRSPQHWPVGTPLLVTRNDAELGLANGDRGLVRPGAEANEAVIASADGPRRLPLSMLSAVEPALALTVHKSQGSQADAVIVLLPPGSNFDRRLLYTAMTRARERLDLLSPALDTLNSPG